jgi:hypothetical protein
VETESTDEEGFEPEVVDKMNLEELNSWIDRLMHAQNSVKR